MVTDLLPNNAAVWDHQRICYKEVGKNEESKFSFDRARDIWLGNKDTPIIPRRNEFL